jgi:murein tripeptide amidase MpaA
MEAYDFDRYLRYAELTQWVHRMAELYPDLVELSSAGKSHEGRDQWLLAVTNLSAGAASEKPAHWVDANIHSTETTAGVAACHLIHYLVTNFSKGTPSVVEALNTRTFYVMPRVNPDGVEAALGDSPNYLRSSVRLWPWQGHAWPGLHVSDITGDGRVLTMRIPDANGAWTPHPRDPRVMIPVDDAQSPVGDDSVDQASVRRYRLMPEGLIENYDGFTIPTPKKVSALDLNRNFPAGWGKDVTGSGEHALSEPEIYNLVRALTQRPNVCGYNAYHTSGGVLLRPCGTKADDDLPYQDVWMYKEMGARGAALTNCTVHSCYEDFTMDKKNETLSGASDDFAYEHLGVFGWTTEFWDVVLKATGHRSNNKWWYVGHSVDENLAIAAWADEHCPEHYVPWAPFQHPQLGAVDIGGPDDFHLISNPPLHLMKAEVAPHAQFAVYQAMLSPRLEVLLATAEKVSVFGVGGEEEEGGGEGEGALFLWRIKVGVANTGFLPTNVTTMATNINAVLPVTVELQTVNTNTTNTTTNTTAATARPVRMADGFSPARVVCSPEQLSGRMSTRLNHGGSDGTPDRGLAQWTVVGRAGESLLAVARHQRAGQAQMLITLK